MGKLRLGSEVFVFSVSDWQAGMFIRSDSRIQALNYQALPIPLTTATLTIFLAFIISNFSVLIKEFNPHLL